MAAAFVLQQHNETSGASHSNSAEVLPEIMRIERLIHNGESNLLVTARLISEQVQRFTQAAGVAIGIVVDGELTYLAAIGSASHEMGLRVPLDSSLSAYCLTKGVTLRSPSAENDTRLPHSAAGRNQIQSLIAVPVMFENRAVGVVEARFNNANSFQENDVQACELMARLVRELIARAGQRKFGFKAEAVTSQAARMESRREIFSRARLRALPENAPDASLDVHAQNQNKDQSSASVNPADESIASLPEVQPDSAAQDADLEQGETSRREFDSAAIAKCRGCGRQFAAEELFCGSCGTERLSVPNGPMQKKWASMWYMNQARKSAEPDKQPVPETRNEKILVDNPKPASEPATLKLEPEVISQKLVSQKLISEKAAADKPQEQKLESPSIAPPALKAVPPKPETEKFEQESVKQPEDLEAQKPQNAAILLHAAALKLKTIASQDDVRKPPSAQGSQSESTKLVSGTSALKPKLRIVEDTEEAPVRAISVATAPQPAVPVVESAPETSVRLEWLAESVSSENWLGHQWRANRANFYLAGAAILLVVMLMGRGITPADQPYSAANPSRPRLTLFESILVGLGVAEAPTTPVYMGNPDTPVWVDTHTAQYYCPGSDLYGKTEGGKIASQRDAQLDQFEPAHRRACN